MKKNLPTNTSSHHSEETEGVLVEAQPFSEDDEYFDKYEGEEQDFLYEEDEEEEEEDEEFFEDDVEEMQLSRVKLHDVTVLRNLYRFALLDVDGESRYSHF
jgi:hypothetical protein